MQLRIGIDLGGTKIEVVALGEAGQVLARHRVPTPQGDYAATLAAVVGPVFDKIAGSMVDAFIARAEKVYG